MREYTVEVKHGFSGSIKYMTVTAEGKQEAIEKVKIKLGNKTKLGLTYSVK